MSVRGADLQGQRKWTRGSRDGAYEQPDAVPVPVAGDEEAACVQHCETAGQLVAAGRRCSLGSQRQKPSLRHRTYTNTSLPRCRLLPLKTVPQLNSMADPGAIRP